MHYSIFTQSIHLSLRVLVSELVCLSVCLSECPFQTHDLVTTCEVLTPVLFLHGTVRYGLGEIITTPVPNPNHLQLLQLDHTHRTNMPNISSFVTQRTGQLRFAHQFDDTRDIFMLDPRLRLFLLCDNVFLLHQFGSCLLLAIMASAVSQFSHDGHAA